MPSRDHHQEILRLQALRGLCLPGGEPLPSVEELCGRVLARFGTEAVIVTVIDHDRQHVIARLGTAFSGSARGDAFCDHLLGSDEVLVVPDARRDPRFATNPLVAGPPYVRFYAGAPLIYRPEVRLGGLCVLDTVPRAFDAADRAELADLAEEAMVLILEQELRRGTDRPPQ